MILVLASFPNQEAAEKTAESLIKKRLAACVHVSTAGTSFYEWEGKLCRETEHQLWAKSEKSLWEPLRDEILSQHPFEVPQILSFNADTTLPSYEAWVLETVKPK